ncbi:DNA repair protein RadC [Clostridiaceae bacterium OttesenSCG-928-D20]|nr:DNA repair protein RadC [Clostridiaceae bacterium OttesenSCG-928-D20]
MVSRDGHRERIRERFRSHGLDSFEDHNVLEILLTYAIPRQDVKDLSLMLINKFGSLDAVFEAKMDELLSVSGIGKNAATLIKLVPEVSRRYMMLKSAGGVYFNTTKDVGDYILPRYLYEKEEVVYLLCLDAMNKLICCKEVGRGVADSATVSIRNIAEISLGVSAISVILIHNHISGIAIPSYEDEVTTRQIEKALSLLGIELIDHIIVAGSDYVSIRSVLKK